MSTNEYVEVIKLLTQDSKNIFKKFINNQEKIIKIPKNSYYNKKQVDYCNKMKSKKILVTRSCKAPSNSPNPNTSCPTFCVLKDEFDKRLKELKKSINNNRCNLTNKYYNNNIRCIQMIIQQSLGLPSSWGNYTGILSFKVKKQYLYKPLQCEDSSGYNQVMVKPTQANNKYVNKLHEITLNLMTKEIKNINIHKIQQFLNYPFKGNGTTQPVSNHSLKGCDYNTKSLRGFREYVIPGGIEMKEPVVYDSFIKYPILARNTQKIFSQRHTI
uniref:Uncharacterized protein n=1 Tax=viral metagenome TaxID=1070528 RepID=A0A6C0F5M9_9ZZZZ|tara:strand:- start:5140 stop:5952 length:813 start_codon:yes stop_codon:yes gene_type:complete